MDEMKTYKIAKIGNKILTLTIEKRYQEKTFSFGFNIGYRDWCKEWSINLFLIGICLFICLNNYYPDDYNR